MFCFRILFLSLLSQVYAQATLLALLRSQDDLSQFLDTINMVPGLAAALNGLSGVTILAPTNAAFNALDPTTPEAHAISSGNANSIEALVIYHVLKGLHPSSSVRYIPQFVHTSLTNQYTFDGAVATHVTGGQNVGIVLNGEAVEIMSGGFSVSTVSLPDTNVNGVIVHKVDHILSLPGLCSDTVGNFGLYGVSGALKKMDLAATIDDARDVTVLVPANEAFDAVGSVLNDASVDKLTSILEYHVVPGSVIWSPTISNSTVKSLVGPDLELTTISMLAYINTAHILVPNIPLFNGVAHIIDAVLNPDAPPVDRETLEATNKPTPAWTAASSVTKVPFASGALTPATTLAVPAIATTMRGIAIGFSSTPAVPAAGVRPTMAIGEALLGAGFAAIAALAL